MPIRVPDYQSKFVWEVDNEGLPIADAVPLGNVVYLAACPLCGCFHEVSASAGLVITPRCLLREYAHQPRSLGQAAPWRTMYETWLKLHPEAAEPTAIRIRMTTIEELNQRPALTVVKAKAKRPRKAKAA